MAADVPQRPRVARLTESADDSAGSSDAAWRSAGVDGESDGLLGLAYFWNEDYEAAVRSLRRAVERDPADNSWRDLYEKATANALCEVQKPVPAVTFFDRYALLAPPTIGNGTLPTPRAPMPPPPLTET